MSTFNLQVVALDRVFYDGPCEALTVPAIDGEKGVLASHEPMVMAITAGEMRFYGGGTASCCCRLWFCGDHAR